MILGLGVDACSVERMGRHSASPHFVNRVFVEEERRYAERRGNPAQHYAGSFAAREALAKASGLGMASLGFQGCWVHRTSEGAPRLRVTEANRALLKARGISRIFLSITHEANLAVAVVLLEGSRPLSEGGWEDL